MPARHAAQAGPAEDRSAGLFWLLCVQFFVAEQVVSRAWHLPYSFARNYVSDLGALGCGPLVCSPLHALMNASFVLQGVLIGTGALLAWKRFGGWGRLGAGLLVACGLGVLVVGLVPEDSNLRLHSVGAVLHFLCGGLGMMAIGVEGLRASQMWGRDGRWGWVSLLAGVAVVTATVSLGQVQGGAAAIAGWGVGSVERVAAYGIAGWMVAMGYLRITSRMRG